MSKRKKYEYVLGDHAREAARLRAQAKLWDPVSHALFDRIGIKRGWRVLEIGPGAGSLHMELRRRVGGTVDAVERSLFSVGAVTTRVDAESDLFLLHPELLHEVLRINTQSGLLSLLLRSTDAPHLTARVEGTEVVLDTADIIRAVSSVHQLLNATGIFISAEKANL